jgi:HPr kinase/phosphorylase
VLIQGDSGIGKSETALELVKRGHRLIADDRVDVYQQDELTLVGEPPRILQHLIEIRGIGIIDVMNLFGASAVRGSMPVQLAVYLESWSKDKKYDRLGSGNTEVEIAEVKIPQVKIPVKTGRNVAIIIEVAAMNFRARTMGYDATKTFEDRLTQLIEENSGQ